LAALTSASLAAWRAGDLHRRIDVTAITSSPPSAWTRRRPSTCWLEPGASENAQVVKDLLRRLIQNGGLMPSVVLFVIDGGKALPHARSTEMFGETPPRYSLPYAQAAQRAGGGCPRQRRRRPRR